MSTSYIAVIGPNNVGVGYLESNLDTPAEREMCEMLFDCEPDLIDSLPKVNGIRQFIDKDGFSILIADDMEVLTDEVRKRVKDPVLMA